MKKFSEDPDVQDAIHAALLGDRAGLRQALKRLYAGSEPIITMIASWFVAHLVTQIGDATDQRGPLHIAAAIIVAAGFARFLWAYSGRRHAVARAALVAGQMLLVFAISGAALAAWMVFVK